MTKNEFRFVLEWILLTLIFHLLACRCDGIVSATIFVAFHIFFMYLGAAFPFKKKYIESSGYFKYIHLIVILLSLLVPVGPVLSAEFVGGFGINSSPPSLCVPRNSLSAFVALVLPVSLSLGIAMSLLLLLIYKVTKVRVRSWGGPTDFFLTMFVGMIF